MEQREKKMDKLKLGDIIKCTSMKELSKVERSLLMAGHGFTVSYDIMTMTWKIMITDIREAADEKED